MVVVMNSADDSVIQELSGLLEVHGEGSFSAGVQLRPLLNTSPGVSHGETGFHITAQNIESIIGVQSEMKSLFVADCNDTVSIIKRCFD